MCLKRFWTVEPEIDLDFTGFKEITSPEAEEIKSALLEIIKNNNFYVLIDNLDEPWINSNQMNSWLRGLILSMRQLKRDFNNLKIITFLRDDIYDEIAKGSDLFDSENEILRIKWKDDNNFSLRKLLATRIATYFKEELNDSLLAFDNKWSYFYPLRLNYGQVPGKYLTTYITERTFSRPREFLQFCRHIIEKSQSEKLPVLQDAVHIAEREYSNWKVRDLVGEYSKTYENLENCILSFSGACQNWQLSYADLVTHYSNLSDEQKIYNKISNKHLGQDDLIKFLFLAGFLRKVILKLGVRTKYLTSIEEKFVSPSTSTFDIHPAFRKILAEM